jgi:hypothetical protein
MALGAVQSLEAAMKCTVGLRPVAAALALAAVLTPAVGFYLPGVAPQDYARVRHVTRGSRIHGGKGISGPRFQGSEKRARSTFLKQQPCHACEWGSKP